MSVSGISSSNFAEYNTQSAQNTGQQIKQDFQQLGTDLQSGNLSAAQADFATLQQALPQNGGTSQTQASATSQTQTSNPIQQAFAQLSQALQSGNLSAAQQDYATIQQDAQNQPAPTHHHHHHGGSANANSATSATSANATSSSTGSTTSSNSSGDTNSTGSGNSVGTLFSELGTALQSGNLSTAQQAYTSLVQDFQQYAQQAGAFSSQTGSTGSTGISVTV